MTQHSEDDEDALVDPPVIDASPPTESTVPTEVAIGSIVTIDEFNDAPFEASGLARLQLPFIFALIVVSFLISILANVFVPWMLSWRLTRQSVGYMSIGFIDIRDMLGFAAGGGLVGQLAILSVYLGMGPNSLKVRTVASSVLATIVCSSYVVGLQVMDWPQPSSLPTFIALLVYGVGLGGFLLASVAIGLVANYSHASLSFGKAPSRKDPDQSFSIGYLIVLTTLVAFVVTIVRASFPRVSESGPPQSQILVMLLLSFQHACYSILLVLCCTWMVLRENKNWQGALGLLALLILACPANLALMWTYRIINQSWETAGYLWSYTVGLIASTIVFLLIARLAGLRLHRCPR